ncbi:MAG: preprotein translocase subunit SecA [Tissierellia bacterium]|nr:preprotein translocase subunit SecA [Tissierellia bacterium]
MSLFGKLFGSYSEKEVKKIEPIVNKIESLDAQMSTLSDEMLREKTIEFKERLKNGETLDSLVPEAFAVVREAAWRVLGMKHFRVQLIGGMVLHQGRIAEMKTGEGKTLVATLPAYLNALSGEGVHIVTVNDYLAKRDREWMGKVYEFLGLTVGCIVHGLTSEERKEAYGADITYGTNNEFGFDYLRDNMVVYEMDLVQRPLNYCIVDEVDSILVDEARTPLIISGKGDESTDLYEKANGFVRGLTRRFIEESERKRDMFNREIREETVDYTVNEKEKAANLTDKGVAKAEAFFGLENLADMENMEVAHHIKQALKAHSTMQKDIDYVVVDGEVIIVDEFTGRLMHGRRYSDGLHQAIEAKENLVVKSESKTLATITFQNYFRMYKKLSGMTGTAKTEEDEFREIYKIDVVEIPTNKPVVREDKNDSLYRHEEAKFKAVLEDIKRCHEKGQPVLVGTISIEKSELLSSHLKKSKIPHQVLNAKLHEKESQIVAQAGRLGAVTIATNMAGRGTDIVLGGNPEFMAKHELKKQGITDEVLALVDGFYETRDEEVLSAREQYQKLYEGYKSETDAEAKLVVEAGGLHIIGTERHESRRIDNQLRGRSGRQGDPGSSQFYISADDDLLRLFAGERFIAAMEAVDAPEDEPLEAGILTKLIESAQKKVEGNNFGIRKHVLKYDDVMNQQREVIYAERRRVLEGADFKDTLRDMRNNLIESTINGLVHDELGKGQVDIAVIESFGRDFFGFEDSEINKILEGDGNTSKIIDGFIKEADSKYEEKEKEFGADRFREIERIVLLQVVDQKWMDHIDAMDQLRQGIGLRAYGQSDPVRAYQVEGWGMYEAMNESIQEDTIKMLYHVYNPDKIERKRVSKVTTNEPGGKQEPLVKGKKVGRNDPCPCGSGKKYKRCCGA